MAEEREEKAGRLRVLQIDKRIRDNTYPNAASLAKAFCVSRSTIVRDIDFLRDRYCAPLEYDRQKNGYYYTDPTFFIKSIMLSEGELLTLSAAMPLLEQYRNTPIESSIKNLFTKLIDMMPADVTVDPSFLGKNISFISDPLPQIDETVFTTVFHALRQHRTILFSYRSLSRLEYRIHTADPYHVVCQKGSWYLLAFCHEHGEVRMFALSRMKDIVCTEKYFTIPGDFIPESYFDPSFGVWNSNERPVKIELLFDAKINTLILERTWHETQEVHQNDDGSVYLSFTSNQMQETLHWVMSFGSAVTVLNPPELVERVRKEAEAVAGKYR
jgi:predicted DNA-binding transcriptional regulator YafY